jgi:hypothetical protein
MRPSATVFGIAFLDLTEKLSFDWFFHEIAFFKMSDFAKSSMVEKR